ncbi:MAG: FtsQ-type POTRA domain-containing protein [Gammaproteobacteria bacterium]|nr:FtsQ-type POTRA domain-containing protein [Gammaproteobacteria bacterium]
MNYSISYMQYHTHRSPKHRLLRYLQYGLLLCAIFTILVVAEHLNTDWDRLMFKEINHVRVEGEYKYIDRFEIEQMLSPFLGSSIGRAEIEVIEKILKDLPWVKNVLIERSWLDDTLVLTIQEREAVAYWGGQALLDRNGEIFTPRLIDNNNLPILDAAANREQHVLHFYGRLSDWLAAVGLRIIHLREDPSRSYIVQLENAPRLILGRHLFEQRIARFIAAYRVGLADYMHRIACVDLRYLDGFAVRWKEDGGSQSC